MSRTMAVCQSCGMDLKVDGRGTEADGSVSSEYRAGCYSGGRFRDQSQTAELMAERASVILRGLGLPEAIVAHRSFGIRNLKRWRAN